MLLSTPSDDQQDTFIDESLVDGSDEPGFDAEQSQQETEAEIPTIGVLKEYSKEVLESIKRQLAQSGHPECYAQGTFWIRAKDPLFSIHASSARSSGLTPVELYHLDVFIWIPNHLPGAPSDFHCPNCQHKLIRNGWNDNPIARRVKHLHRDYLLLTNRWLCPRESGGCNKSYQGTDPHILLQLPRHIQESFPAILTARAAVDKDLLSLMRTCFATRFGPEPFAALMSEMRHLDHAHRELLYLAAASIYPNSGQLLEPFSEFGDKTRYAGTTPSKHYYKAVFVEWMRLHRPYFDRVVASLPGDIIKGDHTFGVSYHLFYVYSQIINSIQFVFSLQNSLLA
jgi:Domain of unknown function (DUF6729)